ITAFTATYGSVSSEQLFTFTASGLPFTSPVTITAPTNFQVSLSSGSGFGSSVVVNTDGTGAISPAVTIHVRMNNGINAGSVTGGNITLVEGATNSSVAIPNSTVDPKPLTISTPSIASKVYDGTTAAGVITPGTLSGFVGIETVTATASATAYSSANVGAAYTSTVSYVLADGTNGGLAANYSAPANNNLTGLAITAKPITISGTSIAPKVYNGSAAAGTITLGAITGLVNTETLAITPSATAYSSANVGAAYTSTVSYAIADGTNGGVATNYSTLANDNLTALSITAAPLTITADSVNKYHGLVIVTPATGITAFTATGLQNSETIGSVTMTYGYGAAAPDTVGVNLTGVTPSAATGGTFTASNYSITYTSNKLSVIKNNNAFLSNLVSTTGALNTAFNKFDLDYDTYVLTAV
ncbi:MAG: YDG domain-containing protein, partial [Dolichospermum sp.]